MAWKFRSSDLESFCLSSGHSHSKLQDTLLDASCGSGLFSRRFVSSKDYATAGWPGTVSEREGLRSQFSFVGVALRSLIWRRIGVCKVWFTDQGLVHGIRMGFV